MKPKLTLQEVATLWGKSVLDVEDMVSDGKIKYIIEEREWVGGALWIRHLFFDVPLYYKHHRERLKRVRDATLQLMQAELKKDGVKERYSALAKHQQDLLDEECGKGKACWIPEYKRGFPLRCTLETNTVAEVWQHDTPQQNYEPPRGAQVYIPRSVAETKPGNQTTPDKHAWIESARVIWEQETARDRTLSQDQIARTVHKIMCERDQQGQTGMTGRGNRVPSAGTILRRVPKGIR